MLSIFLDKQSVKYKDAIKFKLLPYTIPATFFETADGCTVLLETNTDFDSLAVPENIRRRKRAIALGLIVEC